MAADVVKSVPALTGLSGMLVIGVAPNSAVVPAASRPLRLLHDVS